MQDYQSFLQTKLASIEPSGFTPNNLPDFLFDYQAYVVELALQKGKFAIFAGTGLGKTAMQLSWADAVANHTDRPVLILAPLAVAKQTAYSESAKFSIDCQYCESGDDVTDGINITNYQKLDKFDVSVFSGIVLDESSILKSFTGAIRTQLIECFANTPYRLACSATPSPNDHMELGNHAEFLGIMSRTEMLAQYFIHDSSDTSKWRLKGHASNPFWKWLAQWAIMLQRPSDIGFSDANYKLPPLHEKFLKIRSGIKREGELFAMAAKGLKEQRQAKKQTLDMRVSEVAKLVNSSNDQWIVWCETNAESESLTKAIADAVEVKGSDKDAHKESVAVEFAQGNVRVLVSKPSIFGFGMNWQNCHNIAFVGLSNSFELTYQAIRRCYRFGQNHPVNVYYCMTDTDTQIKANLERKQEQFEEMLDNLLDHMKEHTSVQTSSQKNDYTRKVQKGEGWENHLCDCVELAREIESSTIDFSVFSPPFSSLYTYSNSERDMGNCKGDDEFFIHFQFLIKELYRVIRPGRLVSFHCMNLPTSKQNHGFIGIRDFRGDLIRAFEKEGFIFHSEVTIWKNPVVAMQRTKALGLLHKQLCKDSAMSRQGIPDYLVTMRKPGDNDQPVSGMLTDYYGASGTEPTGENDKHKSINIWQRYASPVWMDIDQSDVLNYRDGRGDEDEKHICPLQLGVIRRAIQLWSNPGDLVYSPFSGIGSEGYVALDMGRQFIGSELKESYWNVAVKNLEYIVHKPAQLSLIG